MAILWCYGAKHILAGCPASAVSNQSSWGYQGNLFMGCWDVNGYQWCIYIYIYIHMIYYMGILVGCWNTPTVIRCLKPMGFKQDYIDMGVWEDELCHQIGNMMNQQWIGIYPMFRQTHRLVSTPYLSNNHKYSNFPQVVACCCTCFHWVRIWIWFPKHIPINHTIIPLSRSISNPRHAPKRTTRRIVRLLVYQKNDHMIIYICICFAWSSFMIFQFFPNVSSILWYP